MKKHVTIPTKVFNISLFMILLFSIGQVSAQSEKMRTIEKTFDGKTALWASHRYGDLIMKKGSGNQIKAVLRLKATGNDDSEMDKFLNKFELSASDAADNKIDIKTNAEIQSWNTINNKTTITFKDGTKFKDIKKFEMILELYVPKLRYATLENKYESINVEEGTTDILMINLYDGELDAPGTYNKLNLEMKYSEAVVGNFTSSESELYDSELIMGNGGSLIMNSKYSEVKGGNLQSLKLDTYDDSFNFGGVKETTEIKDKYSEFNFSGDMGNVSLDLYDSKFVVKNAGNVKVNDSKYTEYELQEVKLLYFTSSYDDAVEVANLGTLTVDESKYTEYNVGNLSKEIKFPASYDDAIIIRSVSETFSGFTFDGKYTEVKLPIPSSVKYEIDAYLKYGNLAFPDKELEAGIYKEKNSETTIQGKLKGAGDSAPKIKINSYDGDIRLN